MSVTAGIQRALWQQLTSLLPLLLRNKKYSSSSESLSPTAHTHTHTHTHTQQRWTHNLTLALVDLRFDLGPLPLPSSCWLHSRSRQQCDVTCASVYLLHSSWFLCVGLLLHRIRTRVFFFSLKICNFFLQEIVIFLIMTQSFLYDWFIGYRLLNNEKTINPSFCKNRTVMPAVNIDFLVSLIFTSQCRAWGLEGLQDCSVFSLLNTDFIRKTTLVMCWQNTKACSSDATYEHLHSHCDVLDQPQF